jgi:predicted nucleotidyltransferase
MIVILLVAMSSALDKLKINKQALFDFSDTSDVDILVTFSDNASWSLFDQVQMQDELTAMTGRSVDLVSRAGIQSSRNKLRRDEILSTAETAYVKPS